MKDIEYYGLIKGGYKPLVVLPSYIVLQHPKTFHTVLFHSKKKPSTGDYIRRYISQWIIPGLASDPDVTIPGGMWREWVKVTKGMKSAVATEPPLPIHPPDWPERRTTISYYAPALNINDFVADSPDIPEGTND